MRAFLRMLRGEGCFSSSSSASFLKLPFSSARWGLFPASASSAFPSSSRMTACRSPRSWASSLSTTDGASTAADVGDDDDATNNEFSPAPCCTWAIFPGGQGSTRLDQITASSPEKGLSQEVDVGVVSRRRVAVQLFA